MVITAMLISSTILYPHLVPTSSGFDKWDSYWKGGRDLSSRDTRGSEIVTIVNTFFFQRAAGQWIFIWLGRLGLVLKEYFFPNINIQNCHLVSLRFCSWETEKSLAWKGLDSSFLLTFWCWALWVFCLFLSFFKHCNNLEKKKPTNNQQRTSAFSCYSSVFWK